MYLCIYIYVYAYSHICVDINTYIHKIGVRVKILVKFSLIYTASLDLYFVDLVIEEVDALYRVVDSMEKYCLTSNIAFLSLISLTIYLRSQ